MGCTFFHYWPALSPFWAIHFTDCVWFFFLCPPFCPRPGYFVLYVINSPSLSLDFRYHLLFRFSSFYFFLSLYPLRFRHENKGISVPSPIGSYRQTPSGVAGDTPPNVTISLEARPGRTCAAGSMTTVNWIFRVWPPSGTCSITVLTR